MSWTKTHCRNGHEKTPENQKVRANGVKECVRCKNDRQAEYRARNFVQNTRKATSA